MRQMLKHEGDENIIGVLALRVRAGLHEDLLRVVAKGASLSVELPDLLGQRRRILPRRRWASPEARRACG